MSKHSMLEKQITDAFLGIEKSLPKNDKDGNPTQYHLSFQQGSQTHVGCNGYIRITPTRRCWIRVSFEERLTDEEIRERLRAEITASVNR